MIQFIRWSDWMEPYLVTPQDPKYEKVLFTSHPLNPNITRQTSRRTNQGPLHSTTLRVVCEKCNSGWMSVLEEQAKPLVLSLIKGNFRAFSKDDQIVLSRWLAMKITTTEFSNPKDVCSSQEDRNEIMSGKFSISGWKMWIIQSKGEGWNAKYL